MSSAALLSKGSKYLGKKDGDTFSNIQDAHTSLDCQKAGLVIDFKTMMYYRCFAAASLDASVLTCDLHWECEGTQEGFNPESACSQ